MRHAIALAVILTSTACSETTGIPQVDRARDQVASRIAPGPELRRVGAAADGAVRDAVHAGETGDPTRMAESVGRGVANVACAGAAARGPAAAAISREASAALPDQAVDAAGRVVTGAAKLAGNLPSPC